MSGAKWVKITTDIFDNRKIKHLRRLKGGNEIVLIWIMILTMAGRCNAGGKVFLTENVPYTPRTLAEELGFKEPMIKSALEAFRELNMIRGDDFFEVVGWEEYQNAERLEQIREQTRQRVKKYRGENKAPAQ